MSIVSAVGQMMRQGAPGEPVLYGGGVFTAAGSEGRNRAAVVSSDSSLALTEVEVGAWNPNCDGTVWTMVLNGADMYLGGGFTLVGGQERNRAACVASDPDLAATLRNWNPNCNNIVNTMILDGAHMYLGGSFTLVGSQERNRAACVASDPDLAATLRNWNPDCGNIVYTMVLSGADMYLGGSFTLVGGGTTRNRAACVDSNTAATSPTVRPWNPNCSSTVWTMVLNEADMYLGGFFTLVGGHERIRAACVDRNPAATAPALRNWNPDCSERVFTMILDGADMYLGGGFTLVGGQERNHAACVDSNPAVVNPTVRPWNPDCNNWVDTMLLSGDDMYLGGSFTLVGVETRSRAACVARDPTAANPILRPWHPDCSGSVYTMLLDGDDMYLGGMFTFIGGTSEHLRAFASPLLPDASALDLFPWNPNCDSQVRTMVLDGADMYLGGGFTLVGGQERTRAACVASDPTQANPALREWNPNCSSTVNTMVLNGDDMYLGGAFTIVRDNTRNRAACVASDPTQPNPTLRAWHPDCSGSVSTMVLNGDDMYLGGSFALVGVETRSRAACVARDPNSAATLRNWNPNCNSTVWTMLLNGPDMYLGGLFTIVRDNTRNRAACVASDPTQPNPTLRAWHPDCGGTVLTMLLSGDDMYLGGAFTTVGVGTRNCAACVARDPTVANPILRAWNPDCPGVVTTMLLSGDDMYLGGAFITVSLSDRLRIAAVDSDPDTNFLLDYNLALNNTVNVLISSEGGS